METYNYDDPATPGFGPEGSVTPSVPDSNTTTDVPATPGFGPSGSVTPSVPGSGTDVPATPGFGPVGPVTPTLPGPSTTVRPCVNCGSWPNTTILWTWGNLSPIFSGSGSVSHVRFYNAAVSREPLDIYLNNRLVVSNLNYMEYTNYLHILPGTYRLTVYSRTNPGTAIINTNVQFRGGNYYTLSILGTVNNYSVQLLTS